MKVFALSLLLLVVPGPARYRATSAAQQTIVLTNATVIDGTGGPEQTLVNIVVVKDRITAIGKNVPAGATIIDMKGKYLMPELINCHGHLGNLKDTLASPVNYTPANVRRQLSRYQDYGVGAILSMGTEQPVGVSIRDSSRAGLIPGATMYSAIYGFGVKNGMPPEGMGITHIYRPETAEEAVRDVQELAALHPDVVKMWVDNYFGQYQTMKEEVYTSIIREAHKHHIRVAAHLYHLSDARKLVAAGIDIMAHSIRDAEIDDTLIQEMKNRNIVYIPTLSLDEFAYIYGDDPTWLNDPFFRASLEPGVYEMITSAAYKNKVNKNPATPQEKMALSFALRNLLKLHRAGVLVVLGTDSGATPIRAQGFSEHMELELMVKAGLTPMEAIKAGTFNGARFLRIDKERGTLRPGLKADFIVLDKDPLKDIRNSRTISAVWRDGVKVSSGPLAD